MASAVGGVGGALGSGGGGGGEEVEYRVYGKRWVILLLFALGAFINAAIWFSFAPVSSLAAEYLDVSTAAVNALSIVYMVMYIPGSVMASHLIQRHGLRRSIVVGSALNAVGAAFRYAGVFLPRHGYVRYASVLFGQACCGLAQPIYTNLPATVAGRWFGLSQRELATTIATLINPLGNAAGSVVPSILVTGTTDKHDNVLSTSGMPLLLLCELVFCAVALVAVLLFFDSHPPTPPTRSAHARQAGAGAAGGAVSAAGAGPGASVTPHSPTLSAKVASSRARTASGTYQPLLDDVDAASDGGGDADRSFSALVPDAAPGPPPGPGAAGGESLWADAKIMVRDPSYNRLALGFALGLALFNALLTVIEQLVKPAGYTSGNAGMFGGVLIGTGLVGAAVTSVVLDATHALREALRFGIIMAMFAVLFFCASLRPDNLTVLTVSFSVMGFFLMPLLPIVISNCAEVVYPLPEESGVAVMLMLSQVFSVCFTVLIGVLVDMRDKYENVYSPANIFVVSVLFVAAVILIPYNGEYRRFNHDHGIAARDAQPAPIL